MSLLFLFQNSPPTSGVQNTSSNITLFTWGHLPNEHLMPMFIGGNSTASGNTNLFLDGNAISSGTVPLSMANSLGIIDNYDNGPQLTLVVAGSNGSGNTAGITLFTWGNSTADAINNGQPGYPSGIPLYLLPNVFIDNSGPAANPTLFILPTQAASGNPNLFIHGQDVSSGTITLVMKVNTPASGGISLAMSVTPAPADDNINLFITAPTPTPQDGSSTLILTGSTTPALFSSIPLSIAVGASGSQWNDNMNLFLLADPVSPLSTVMNMYIPGYGNVIDSNTTLFLQNTLSSINSGVSLFLNGPPGLAGGSIGSGLINLFIGKGTTNFTSLFMQCASPISGVTYLYTFGAPNITSSVNFAMPNTLGIGSGTPSLFMVGF